MTISGSLRYPFATVLAAATMSLFFALLSESIDSGQPAQRIETRVITFDRKMSDTPRKRTVETAKLGIVDVAVPLVQSLAFLPCNDLTDSVLEIVPEIPPLHFNPAVIVVTSSITVTPEPVRPPANIVDLQLPQRPLRPEETSVGVILSEKPKNPGCENSRWVQY
jgi:hypothetical protein